MAMKCALLGERLSHSYSKEIHSHLSGYSYELIEVSSKDAEKIIKSGEFSGLNVTIPYKELAYSLCDELSDAAREIGAVNTIVYRDGKICGHNTDAAGLIAMINRAEISVSGKRVLVLGSGGTSKTAQYAAKKLGARDVTVVSRSGVVNYENVYERCSDAEIIINTTPVGMYPKTGIAPVDISRFEKLSGVVDVIYNPKRTKLLLDAEALGIKNTGGLYMLAAQGFFAAELFFGEKLSSSLLDRAAKKVARGMENIVLIGMPGSGKSSVGRLVAERLGRKFVDTDEVIRERFGVPGDIITEKGESFFRALETDVLREFGKGSAYVLSTGGGVVEREENYNLLHQNGKIYLLERELSRLATDSRPLSRDVFALYQRRCEKYLRFADEKISNNSHAEDAAQAIAKAFE
ncbi:MAG: shikimate dehydrogenase [Oscillospiraceae bacterium]|nr:shikimate dehydrogenase [Oscillospiraceae bacterium]